MEENQKVRDKNLKYMVYLHQSTLRQLVSVVRKKQEKEVDFCPSLRENLKEGK